MVFDGGILREAEEVTIAQGRRTVVTAVEHVATGTLVGLTTISVLAQRPDVVFQDDTVVLQEHRGNKLGLLIKVANMERLTEQFPDARVIYTWNAPENRYLLTVNQQLGFHDGGRDRHLAEGTAGLRTQQQLSCPRHCLAGPIWNTRAASRKLGGPKTVGCWKSTLPSQLTLQSCAGEPVDFRTKDPEHRAAGAGERSKAPRSWTASSQAPCICAGRF